MIFEIRAGEPVLRAQRVTYTVEGDVVELVNFVYRGDFFRLHFELVSSN